MGHAGSGFLSPLNPYNPLPSNSMGSIVKAMEEDGADGVEVDVHVSMDGVPILYHDTRLESMSEGEGMIEELPANRVVGIKYKGGLLYEPFHDERLISMEDMLQRFQTYPEWPYLHIDVRNHSADRYTFYAESVLELLRSYNYPLERVAFIFPDPAQLHVIGELEPGVMLMLDAGDDFELSVKQAVEHNLPGIVTNARELSKEKVQYAKDQGLQVVLFGGKSRATIARMLKMAPDAIQVNNVKRMRALMGRE